MKRWGALDDSAAAYDDEKVIWGLFKGYSHSRDLFKRWIEQWKDNVGKGGEWHEWCFALYLTT